jgi:hypothetical protein
VPENEVKLRITADASGVKDGANQAKEYIEKASQSVSILGDLVGIKVSEGMQKLVSSSELLGPALAKAFPALAVISFIKQLDDLYEEHKQLTAAIYGQSDAWRSLDGVVLKFSDDSRIKLLEIRERIDAITGGPLKVFKDKLELIDAQSFDRLKLQFQSIADEAKKAFIGMEESWFKAFLFGEQGAQEGIKNVADNFDLLMDQIKAMEKSHDMAGIGRLLDEQITKTKEIIKTDETWAGTAATKQIIAANERLLQVLQDLKQAYSEVQQEAAESKKLETLEAPKPTGIITLPSQKNRIQAVHQENQEEVADFQQMFAAINNSTGQFNNQQLSILMTGINGNSQKIIERSRLYFKKIEDDEAASLARRRKLFDRSFQGISAAFGSFINGIVSGNETLGQAWANMVNQMSSKFLQGLEQQLMGFLEHKLMELTIHASTEKAKDIASKAAHAKEDERTAYSAAKAAWESVVHTPIVGPILAPIAAATTFAAVTAFGSAEGGQYYVPNNQLTMLHPQEMVLPAGIANQMRSVIGGGGNGGGGVTVVVNHSVSAVDAASFQGHIRRHSNMIANEVTRALKRKGVR